MAILTDERPTQEQEPQLLIPEVEEETRRRRRQRATRAALAMIAVAMVAAALVLAGVAGAGGDRGAPSPGGGVSPLAVAGTLRPVGFPHTSATVFFEHVSCASGTSCVVVGEVWGRTTEANGAWRYEVGAWHQLATPLWTNRDGTGPLSCPTTSFCMMASNDWRSARGAELHASVQVYMRGAWHETNTPSPAHSYHDQLEAVDCVTSSWCMALGVAQFSTGRTQAYADRYENGRWTLLAVPRSPGEARLGLEISIGGLSCTSPTFCLGVGNAPDAAGSFAIAAQYDGQTWRAINVPRLPKSELGRPGGEITRAGKFKAFPWNQSLTGVACATATDCTASGAFDSANAAIFPMGGSFVMHFDGTAFTKQLLLAKGPVLGHPSGTLAGIACAQSGRCAAFTQEDPVWHGLRTRSPVDAVQLDGSGWYTSSWIYRSGLIPWPSDVSCLANGRCLIVGTVQRPSSPQGHLSPLVLIANARSI